MEAAREKFKETVNQTKLFFTKEKKKADKLSYKQFDGIILKLKKLLAKCNGNDKEEVDEDDKWSDDIEEAIKEHGGWNRYDADIKKFKEKWDMIRFQEEFIPSGENADDENSSNKNKKRKRPNSVVILDPPTKKRKKDQNLIDVAPENGIDEKEVCLMVLLTITLLPEGYFFFFLRFCVSRF